MATVQNAGHGDANDSSAKDFIRKLLIVDPHKRLTAREALQHPWLKRFEAEPTRQPAAAPAPQTDLLPNVRDRFNARKMFRKAVDVVKAVNKLANSPNGTNGHNSANSSVDDVPPSAKGPAPMDVDAYRPKDDYLVDGNLMVLSRPQAV